MVNDKKVKKERDKEDDEERKRVKVREKERERGNETTSGDVKRGRKFDSVKEERKKEKIIEEEGNVRMRGKRMERER
jgi:hypothetical protein